MRHAFLLSSVASAQVLPGQMEMVSRWSVVLLDTWLGLTGAWTTPSTNHPPPHSTSTASPSPAQITSRPTPESGWLGFCPYKTFSVSLTIFSLILAMFWQLQGLFFSSLSTCLMLRATGETQNPAEHPGMQSICNESQLQRCQRGLFQTERGNEGGGVGVAAAELVSRAGPGKRSGNTGWKEERKPPGKICTGTTPLKHHLLHMDGAAGSSSLIL